MRLKNLIISVPLLENEDGERAKSDLSHDKLALKWLYLFMCQNDCVVKVRTVKITFYSIKVR